LNLNDEAIKKTKHALEVLNNDENPEAEMESLNNKSIETQDILDRENDVVDFEERKSDVASVRSAKLSNKSASKALELKWKSDLRLD